MYTSFNDNLTNGDTDTDIWALPFDRNGSPGKPFPVVQTKASENKAQFSPDGKWIAYQSDASGRDEIYVQPFAGPEQKPGARSQVSPGGGMDVRWGRQGTEVFYVSGDGRLMTVPIRLASERQSLEIGAPVPLFPTLLQGSSTQHRYAVSADGQRFLMAARARDVANESSQRLVT